jgi:hypothetical protein
MCHLGNRYAYDFDGVKTVSIFVPLQSAQALATIASHLGNSGAVTAQASNSSPNPTFSFQTYFLRLRFENQEGNRPMELHAAKLFIFPSRL